VAALPYCTDEDIAIQAGADFLELCPKDQVLATGVDGTFLSDGWTLASASVNFAGFGLFPPAPVTPAPTPFEVAAPVIALSGGTPSGLGANILLSVASVAGAGATLRRKGLAAGVGAPPGLVPRSGIAFVVPTLAPQIEDASYDLDRRYGVDELVYGRRTADEYDPRELRRACVLTVLYRQYFAAARAADDTFARKAKVYQAELTDLLARAAVRWLPSILEGPDDVGSRFGMKLVR
jgi:hypothetical protein